MNWGTRIVIVFVCFVALIATMITICMRQDVSLVAQDYYVQEIAYQDQIDRIKNASSLGGDQLLVDYDRGSSVLSLNIPNKTISNGEIHFFRPSDASLDKKYIIRLDESGAQNFDLTTFKKGLWKVKINWNRDGKEYYEEQSIVI
ncbi:FixH family protein [Fulvivirga maritima]|uniref:FixH family protein n=1 Tax=Fulvivirga maritima TaxID=2904247 RepID=UPI001F373503|nr:FixH family protein [Fulvivirga maritima]UII25586.1 FixH family protein [Fulvivirga maritima]